VSRKVMADGLPDWTTSPMFLLTAALVGIIVVRGVAAVLPGSEQSELSSCFHLAGSRLVQTFDKPLSATDPSYRQWMDRGNQHKAERAMLAAMDACQVDNCPTTARESHRQATRAYVSDRAWDAQKFFIYFGEPGLAEARSSYDTIVNQEIMQGMAERYAAGVLLLDGFGELKTPARMLLEGNPAEFGPCRVAPDAKEFDDGGVRRRE
jgi:hypothetical protein